MRRSLSLKRESLTALTNDEMSAVQGGSHVGCTITHGVSCEQSCPTVPFNDCIEDLTMRACPTNPYMCA